MKIANILFNHKKTAHDNKILGVERCFIDYAKYLTLKGASLLSVTKNGVSYIKDLRETGSQVLQLPGINRVDIFSILPLAFSFIKFRPDVAICHSGRALSYARAARFLTFQKFPIIAIDHGVNPKKFMKADYVLAVNNFFSQELVRAGKPADRALTIPNMIEVPKNFSPLAKKNFRKPLKLGSLGRLYPEKNFDKVIRAIKILRDEGIECEYVIGGVGPQEQPLNDLAREMGVEKNFKILGWTTDKRKFFDEIDIFILPSWGETFGIVLLEAMLYSTPIITSNSWGPDEVIQDGINGLKVSKDDADSMPELLAEAILKLVKDEEFAKKIAQKAHEEFFLKYTTEVVTTRLHNICKQAYEEYKK